MKYFVIFVFCGYLALEVDSYVLLQVSKQENHSNVDAVVHKELGKDEFDKIAGKIKSRKRLSVQSDDSDSGSTESEENVKNLDEQHIVFGVKTNAKTHEKSTAGVDTLIQTLKKIFQGKDPMFRSKKFSLRASSEKAKPSVGVEIDTQSVIATVKKFLGSQTFKRTANDIAKKAAIVLRSLKEEM